MNKIIYHGSYVKIEFPQIRKHKFTKDFSHGLYCTDIKEQASSKQYPLSFSHREQIVQNQCNHNKNLK